MGIRRLGQSDSSTQENQTQNQNTGSALSALQDILGESTGEDPSCASIPTTKEVVSESDHHEEVKSVPEEEMERVAPSQEDRPTPPVQNRTTQDALGILNSLAPVFRAATIYPGSDADPSQVAAAVRKMSLVAVELAEFVASLDVLELDPIWARKALHDFMANLVASHWVSTVIARGGVVAGHSPDVTSSYFIPALQTILSLPMVPPASQASFSLSQVSAMRLAVLNGLAPLTIEIEKFEAFVLAHAPTSTISAKAMITDVFQFVIDEAAAQSAELLGESIDPGADDQQEVLRAVTLHTANAVLASWEHCRGQVLSSLQQAQNASAAAAVLSQPGFEFGFPMQMLKERAAESLRRLTGTTVYALTMLRQTEQKKKGA